jgi:hypothetical protein
MLLPQTCNIPTSILFPVHLLTQLLFERLTLERQSLCLFLNSSCRRLEGFYRGPNFVLQKGSCRTEFGVAEDWLESTGMFELVISR